MKRHGTKTFLPAGLLSLILLPGALYWTLSQNPATHPKVAIEVNLPPGDVWEWIAERRPYVERPPDGHWKNFHIADKKMIGDSELEVLRATIQGHIVTRDTSQGIQIHFDRQSPYAAFVQVIDLLQEVKCDYEVYGPDIWIMRFPTLREREQLAKGFHFADGVTIIQTQVDRQPLTLGQQLISYFLRYRFLLEETSIRVFGVVAILLVVMLFVSLRQGLEHQRSRSLPAS